MRFLIKLILFTSLIILPYLLVKYRLMILDQDPFYWKATEQVEHLVLGGSRGMQGIFPHVIQETLDLEGRFLNFAFTGVLSPYGETYVRAIERKLIRAPKRPGLFILSVNPGIMMDFTTAVVPRENAFRFYKLWSMNTHPNIEYMLRQPRKGQALFVKYIDHYVSKRKPKSRVFRDGSKANYRPIDHVPPDRDVVLRYPFEKSPAREQQLEELIQLLATRGHVFLVRTPISTKTLREENEIYANFNARMDELAGAHENTWYFNYSTVIDNYQFFDGNHHLEGTSAEDFSRQLARDIENQINLRNAQKSK